MKASILYTTLFSIIAALSDLSTSNALRKRESGEFSCYTTTNIWDFSALCPNINYPITNNRGLSTMGTLYFALATTTLPDDTVYNAQENIICTVNGPTPNITVTVGAGVGNDIVSAEPLLHSTSPSQILKAAVSTRKPAHHQPVDV